LRDDEFTHVAIAFDAATSLAAREQDDTARIHAQFDLALDVCRALGITLWPMSTQFQADDALATAAHRFADEVELDQIVICSSDNDFAQCVRGERIVVLNRIKRQILDEFGVADRFGVTPERIPEYLALVGDKSDGLPGFGPKAAAAVICRYGAMERIPIDETPWDLEVRGKERLQRVFRERRQEAILYRNLSVKRVDVPLPESLADLRWHGALADNVRDIQSELADDSLTQRTLRFRD
jgi:5'-3' exonuclease